MMYLGVFFLAAMDFVLCDFDQFVSMEVFDEDNGEL